MMLKLVDAKTPSSIRYLEMAQAAIICVKKEEDDDGIVKGMLIDTETRGVLSWQGVGKESPWYELRFTVV